MSCVTRNFSSFPHHHPDRTPDSNLFIGNIVLITLKISVVSFLENAVIRVDSDVIIVIPVAFYSKFCIFFENKNKI